MLGVEYTNYTVDIDKDTCCGCAACVNVCACGVLEMGESGPVISHPERCMGCTQCTAVCPTRAMHAVKRPNAPADQAEPVPTEDYGDKKPFLPLEDLARHIAARRSVRNFKDDIPSREVLESVIRAANYAPTACNYRKIKYAVISDPEHIKRLRELCMEMFPMPRVLMPAPVVMLVMNITECPDDTAIACTTVDLLARSVGLGVTFAGLVRRCIEKSEKVRNYLRDELGLKEIGNCSLEALYLGYPNEQANYLRPAVRDPLPIAWL